MSFDGISLHALVRELHAALQGGRIDKVFQPDKYSLLLWVRQPSATLHLLLSANPSQPGAYLVDTVPENPEVPPSFCMLLRKHFEDGRIAQVTQHGLDRIIQIDVDVRGAQGLIETKSFFIECMGKHSNLLFVHNTRIVDAIRRVGSQMNRHRSVVPGALYLAPPGQNRINLLLQPAPTLIAAACQQPGALSKALIAAGLGIGPVTAREIVWQAGLPAAIHTEELDAADQAALTEAVEAIISRLQAPPEPHAYFDTNDRLLATAAFPLGYIATASTTQTFATMSEACVALAARSGPPSFPAKEELERFIHNEQLRLLRKAEALTADQAAAEDADIWRVYADTLMAHLYSIPAGAKEANVLDIYNESPEERYIRIPLDPALSANANAQAYYSRYNKLKRAQVALVEQIDKCRAESAYLATIAVGITHCITQADLADIRQELTASGYLAASKKKRMAQPLSKPLELTASDGTPLLVGKNNRQNDLLTFKTAGPHDIWLHTKDIPGSHVILRCGSAAPTPEALAEAAQLAAWHSQARQSSHVPVDYTRRRYVKKPSGAKPGFVIYEQQTTLTITPDAALIERLLATQK